MKPLKISLCLLLLLCLSVSAKGNASRQSRNWKPIFQGIDYLEGAVQEPRLMRFHIVRIDMQAEGIRFYTTPRLPENQCEKGSETDRENTVDFLKKHGLQFAVNANFFSLPEGGTMSSEGRSNLLGLAVSEGKIVSPAENGFYPFCVLKDGKPVIPGNAGDELAMDEVDTAVAGHALTLQTGEITETAQKDESVHPRTAVGVSEDQRYVYFLVVDGRQGDFSLGATLGDMAKALKKAGAWNAVNLDGGGSTTMVREDANGKPQILNTPVGKGKPGSLRSNGNNIGIWAMPL